MFMVRFPIGHIAGKNGNLCGSLTSLMGKTLGLGGHKCNLTGDGASVSLRRTEGHHHQSSHHKDQKPKNKVLPTTSGNSIPHPSLSLSLFLSHPAFSSSISSRAHSLFLSLEITNHQCAHYILCAYVVSFTYQQIERVKADQEWVYSRERERKRILERESWISSLQTSFKL